ncbi:NAD(P)-binding Rossmann-fold superfamily protein [Heracleum sosnowskyi]|uniref:NAD(P)-binding Rossmann-fold superfamily protein n=1 Tax=Heracleum sosnowskyi TaxID=360622 RepID=A0AAD8GYY6_9APIA|nr:NAD(P)-binding Rossmann-fold superfamily protein [Heracleum sosnowskyi]
MVYVVNGRSIMNSGAGKPPEFNPWAGKPVSQRKKKLVHVVARIGDVRLREPLEFVDSLIEEVTDRTVDAFLEQVKDGSWATGGWPQTFTDYSISKLAVNAYTRLMAKKFSYRPEGEKIYINCCCPGWLKTAMTGWEGNISPVEGPDTAVWLALLLDQFVACKFFAERREINF